jgi:hypothetical protein
MAHDKDTWKLGFIGFLGFLGLIGITTENKGMDSLPSFPRLRKKN